MFRTRLSAGVEVNASALRIALVVPRPTPTVVKVYEQELAPGDEVRAGLLAAQALDRLGAKGADVHLAFAPGRPGASRHQLFVAPRKLRAAELNQLALRELKRDTTLDAGAALFAVERLGLAEGEGSGDSHLLVALARAEVEPVAAALLDAKKVVRSATSSAMALYRAAAVSGLPADGVVALALLERRRSSLIVLDHGVPKFFRNLPSAFGAGHDAADEAVASQALARELDLSLVYFAQQFRPKQVGTVMIVGEPAFADRVSDWLEESPKYEVMRFGASPRLAIDPAVTGSLAPFAVAIGAALGPKSRAVPDLLPAELKGQPERALVFVAAGVVLLAFVAGTVHLRQSHVERLDRQTARLDRDRNAFAQLARRVEAASKIDLLATDAQRWEELFEDQDSYHRRAARLLYSLPSAVPAHAKLLLAELRGAPPLRLQPGQPPPAKGTAPNLQLHLEGTVKAADIDSAQAELRSLVEAAEKLPTVTSAELAPIKAPATTGGILELPFTLDLAVRDRLPELKR